MNGDDVFDGEYVILSVRKQSTPQMTNEMKAIQREILDAVRKDDPETLNALLTAAGDDAETVSGNYPGQRNLLHFAAGCGSNKCIGYLLEAGLDAGAQDGFGLTPLHVAVKHRQHACIPMLLSGCGDPNTQEIYCPLGKDKTVAEAIAQGEIDYGNTPLLTAIRNRDIESVRLLLQDERVDVNVVDRLGFSPLHVAIKEGVGAGRLIGLVGMLLNVGADPNKAAEAAKVLNVDEFRNDNDSEMPLHLATMKGAEDVMELLVLHGADINGQTASGQTALHVAANTGKNELVEALILYGADYGIMVDGPDSDGNTPLHRAAANGLEDATSALLRLGADPNALNGYGRTPLMLASLKGQTACVSRLLKVDQGVDLDRRDHIGKTALHFAAAAADPASIELLVSAGAALEAKDNFGSCPLLGALYATLTNRRAGFECINLLVKKGADLNVTNKWGWTLLHEVIAESGFDADHLHHLLYMGARPDIKDRIGDTPLMSAIERGQAQHVNELLKFGADANIRCPKGYPLALAIKKGDVHIIESLIKAGASTKYAHKLIGKSSLSVSAGKQLKELIRETDSEISSGRTKPVESAGDDVTTARPTLSP